jgi:hypothetical protein
VPWEDSVIKRKITLRALSKVLLALLILCLSISVASKTASARVADVTLYPTQGSAGSTVTVNGQGFSDSSTVTISFNGQQVQQTFATCYNGGLVYGKFIIPASTADGTYNVTVKDTAEGSAIAYFTVGASLPSVTPNSSPDATPTYAPYTHQPTSSSQNVGFLSQTLIVVIGVLVAVAVVLPVTFMLRNSQRQQFPEK